MGALTRLTGKGAQSAEKTADLEENLAQSVSSWFLCVLDNLTGEIVHSFPPKMTRQHGVGLCMRRCWDLRSSRHPVARLAIICMSCLVCDTSGNMYATKTTDGINLYKQEEKHV